MLHFRNLFHIIDRVLPCTETFLYPLLVLSANLLISSKHMPQGKDKELEVQTNIHTNLDVYCYMVLLRGIHQSLLHRIALFFKKHRNSRETDR